MLFPENSPAKLITFRRLVRFSNVGLQAHAQLVLLPEVGSCGGVQGKRRPHATQVKIHAIHDCLAELSHCFVFGAIEFDRETASVLSAKGRPTAAARVDTESGCAGCCAGPG